MRQRAEPLALPAENIDAADAPIGIGIKLDLRLAAARSTRRRIVRNIDNARGAADAERRGRRRDRHVAALRHETRDEGDRAARDVEHGLVALGALLVDEFVDDDARICAEAQRRVVVEGHAERRVAAGRQHVILVDGVADLERRSRSFAARHARATLQRRNLSDRIVRCLASGRLRLRARRKRPRNDADKKCKKLTPLHCHPQTCGWHGSGSDTLFGRPRR